MKSLHTLVITFSLLIGNMSAVNAQEYDSIFRNRRVVHEDLPIHIEARNGDAISQNNLGVQYQTGNGVSQDYAEAVRWYRLAAAQGNPVAQFNLGLIYEKGLGVLQDYNETVKWYRLSAEQRYTSAQFSLGLIYKEGKVVRQSNIMAHMWFNIASTNGKVHARTIMDEARAIMDELVGLMTSADISEAQSMARECMNSGYINCGD